jgi:arsenite-transporting ATPase
MDPDALLDQIDNELQDMDFVLEPNIQNLLDKKSLKWIFVGGKGGVGKTTTSCSIAVSLAKVRESVLIISTDPAHNLSDAFGQQFSKEPCLVEGFKNLYAMEVDPTIELEDNSDLLGEGQESNMFKDFALAIPGIDEAAGFAEVMKLVQSMKFETIVFDTAPTGHTLRLLAFPSVLDKGLGKIMSIKNKIGGLFSTFSSMIPGLGAETPEQLTDKLEGTKKVIEEVNKQFKNPDLTTFVCVCIPEFLSLYETERLVQELTKFEIDVNNIVINQVLYPDAGKCSSLRSGGSISVCVDFCS